MKPKAYADQLAREQVMKDAPLELLAARLSEIVVELVLQKAHIRDLESRSVDIATEIKRRKGCK